MDKKRLSVLKKVISDEALLAKADRMALTQSELDALLESGENEIYLVSNEFRISLKYEHIVYIGIDNPCVWVTAEDNCDFYVKESVFRISGSAGMLPVSVNRMRYAELSRM